MGTDVHTVVQVKIKDSWITIGSGIFEDRNYDSFGLLANVRNGRGFAGVDTGDGWIPVSEPKGLPDDFKVDDNDTYHEGEWVGDHSHSYLTLAELINYPHWNKGTKKRGFVPEAEYLKLRSRDETPTCYSGGVCGANVVTIDSRGYNALERAKDLPKGKSIYVQMEWGRDYKENKVYTDLIPELKRLAEENQVGSEDIRFVFGFDS